MIGKHIGVIACRKERITSIFMKRFYCAAIVCAVLLGHTLSVHAEVLDFDGVEKAYNEADDVLRLSLIHI